MLQTDWQWLFATFIRKRDLKKPGSKSWEDYIRKNPERIK